MKEHFDLIAIPKGQIPGGPIQASDGSWYIVLSANMELGDTIKMIKRHRAGRPITDAEFIKASKELPEHISEEVEGIGRL